MEKGEEKAQGPSDVIPAPALTGLRFKRSFLLLLPNSQPGSRPALALATWTLQKRI